MMTEKKYLEHGWDERRRGFVWGFLGAIFLLVAVLAGAAMVVVI